MTWGLFPHRFHISITSSLQLPSLHLIRLPTSFSSLHVVYTTIRTYITKLTRYPSMHIRAISFKPSERNSTGMETVVAMRTEYVLRKPPKPTKEQ